MIAEISFVPIGVGASLSKYVARMMELIKQSGLKYEFHSMGTNVEGDWASISALVGKCIDELQQMGAPRVLVRLVADQRFDKVSGMEQKKRSVEEKLKSV